MVIAYILHKFTVINNSESDVAMLVIVLTSFAILYHGTDLGEALAGSIMPVV